MFFLFLQPRKAEETAPVDPVESRAGNGDIDAVRSLRKRYIAQHQNDLADYWLYKGALMGDAELSDEYIAKFRALPEQAKQAEIQSIKTSTASENQKDGLLQKLIGTNK